MSKQQTPIPLIRPGACGGCCVGPQSPGTTAAFSRRGFLQGLGATGVALSGLAMAGARTRAASAEPVPAAQPFPSGKPLRVKPILVYDRPTRGDRTSWRNYGDIHTPAAAQEEADRIVQELGQLVVQAEFPLEVLPIDVFDSQARLEQVAVADTDLCLVYAAGYVSHWPLPTPMLMFVRHRSGPFYLGFEIAHWRFLRGNGDTLARPDYDADDVVVDSYEEMLWRLRSWYGLKNARGTRMLTIGGLAAYSAPAQEHGPRVARELWDYDFVNVTDEQFTQKLAAARSNQQILEGIERQTLDLLALPNVTLQTDRKFVYNSFLALHAVRELLQETGAGNFGFAHCMGHGQITMLDTPACLVLSLANDEGYTAFCHTDLSHTLPGVLLRWIASRPAFVCNTHVPHQGLFFVAHCQAPRRMNGRDYEPATIMTHYESDYGAACKTHYQIGQVVSVVVPNLACTHWQGFRGQIVGAPSYPACRSQMEIQIDGDWHRLLHEMQGFHAQIVYGDYTREIGYALKKLGGRITWDCFSPVVLGSLPATGAARPARWLDHWVPGPGFGPPRPSWPPHSSQR
jgi:hypothetical protein